MKEITEKTGINNSTIIYYISLGLLPEPIKTSKNMAYYPDLYLRIIPVILYFKENMHLPLATIKRLIDNIGYDKISVENALHYYETFLKSFNYKENIVNYGKEEFIINTCLDDKEINELESKEMILSPVRGSYYHEDLLTAKAYKTLKDYGIPFTSIERLAVIIKKLVSEVHEIYHEHEGKFNEEEELEFTKVLQNELDIIFHYLMSKYSQKLFKNESSK